MNDLGYLLDYIHTTPRYADVKKAIRPERVYADPAYPRQAVMVELPYDVPLSCEDVDWMTSRLSHRLPFYQPDHLGFFARLRLTHTRQHVRRRVEFVFLGEECFLVWQKWLFFTYRGKNLLTSANTGRPDTTYINYTRGCLWADHPNLRRLFAGLI